MPRAHGARGTVGKRIEILPKLSFALVGLVQGAAINSSTPNRKTNPDLGFPESGPDNACPTTLTLNGRPTKHSDQIPTPYTTP